MKTKNLVWHLRTLTKELKVWWTKIGKADYETTLESFTIRISKEIKIVKYFKFFSADTVEYTFQIFKDNERYAELKVNDRGLSGESYAVHCLFLEIEETTPKDEIQLELLKKISTLENTETKSSESIDDTAAMCCSMISSCT